MEITCGKRKVNSKSSRNSKIAKIGGNGEKLCKDVLESVFHRLNFLDMARAKLVCSNWRSILKIVEKSYAQSQHVPWLLIPNQNELCLLNPEEKKSFNIQTNVGFDFFGESCYVVGSSHGCLIYMNDSLIPVILNPLNGSKIQISRFFSNDCIILKSGINGGNIYKSYPCESLSSLGSRGYGIMSQYWLRKCIVDKLILSSNPFSGENNFYAAMIYGEKLELAYYNNGDSSWIRLDQDKEYYDDIIFHQNKLYAVHGEMTHVEIWDFNGNSPKKMMRLELSVPAKLLQGGFCLGHYYDTNCKLYLVESRGKVLLVVRQIADNVDDDGNVVEDPESVQSETNHPLVFPYGTVLFCVFELDMVKQEWVEVKSLDGCALFLGGNHSLSISTQQDNCIYFTDDSWGRMEEDNTYGGHDRGFFSMNDGKVRKIDDFGRDRMEPSPCWIVPMPW